MKTESRAVQYLVTEDNGTTHLPYTDASGKPDHRLMGAAFASLHSGYRGKKYAGPDKAKAIEKLAAVYKSEGMDMPDESKSAAADELRVPFVCPNCGYEGDTDELNDMDEGDGMNSLKSPKMVERHAMLQGFQKRTLLLRKKLSADILRSMSDETKAGMCLIQQCRAACGGVLEYVYRMPYDAFPDEFFTRLYECGMACDVCLSLAGRESVLAPEAHELCAAACREYVSGCDGTSDELIQALANICMKTAACCDSMGAAGESEEDRAARQELISSAPPCETQESRAARIRTGEEVRTLQCDFRSDGNGRTIVGYPVVFNSLSQDLGGFRELILPDAVTFAEDVRADYNHDSNFILGRQSAGTLRLSIDKVGVRMEADAPETGWANDLLVSMKRGDITQGSFAFRVNPNGQSISTDANGQQIRTLSSILVRKVSIVADPAYLATDVAVRSAVDQEAVSANSVPSTINRLRHLRLKLLEVE